MTDFVLGRLKFTFKGAWAPSTPYLADDIVRYGGQSYVCKTNHTSAAGNNFYTDLTASKWEVITSGTDWKGEWQTSTYYKVNDVVKYGGTVYVANVGHMSNINTNYGLEADYSKWVTYSASPYWRGDWTSNTRYRTNDLVQYGGSLFLINTPHFSNGVSIINAWTTNEANTSLFVGGLEFEDSYNSGTVYNVGDIVRYGGYNFICIEDTIGNLPTNTTYWKVLTTGFKHRGDYVNVTAYQPGDVVRYGASVYVAKSDTTGNAPSNTTYWDLLSQGQKWAGQYSANATYTPGDLVQYGGYLYAANVTTSNNAPTLTSAYWNLQQAGIKWNNLWNSSNVYQLGDVVMYSNSSYISVITDNSNVIPGTLGSGSNWNLVSQGSYDTFTTTPGDITYRSNVGMTRLGIGSVGQALLSDGLFPVWGDNGATANVFYVAPEGVDDGAHGSSLSAPFASIKYACQQAPAGATIFVKSGQYYEQLPIVVPTNTAIVGDSQRTVKVLPKVGLSDDGINQNYESTMWQLSDGAILNKMTFGGMTGWVPGGTASDVTTSTPKAIVVGFNPATPITHKSPYVLECAFIGDKAIGALVDGTVHGSGNKSMIFHGYTVISSDGIGYWTKDGGKAEIVSCFTYFCYFGYTSSGGGQIRALNGNNSYGTWGATSRGFDASETPLTGNIFGRQINVVLDGNAIAGDTVTGPTGNTAIVTNVQASADKIYVSNISGTFISGQTVTFSSGGTGTVVPGGLEDQQGFVLVLKGLNAIPRPGASISIFGDNTSYVIQSVSGTYTNTNSIIAVVLAQEKPTGSADGSTATIRYKYSQVRLTGHDFLSIGTGNVLTTNYPGTPNQPVAQGNEVDEAFPGRVFCVSTDQDGNFRVGEYFRIDQATGRATLNASAFDLAGLTSLRLGSIGAQLGETINEFSSDVTLSGNSNQAVPTEYAVKTYSDSVTTSIINSTSAELNKIKFVAYINQII